MRPLITPDSGSTTSVSLLIRIRDPADEQAWREFEARYCELVLRYCLRRGLQRVDSEDVRQQVWINLAKGLRNFEYDPKRGRFRGYLGRVVGNAISRHFSRRASNDLALDSAVLASTPADNGDADGAWEQEWVNHHYRLAIQRIENLYEPRSVAVFKRLLAGGATDEVAGEFDMTPNAVRQVKHRIQKRMQELIAYQVREEDEPDLYGSRA